MVSKICAAVLGACLLLGGCSAAQQAQVQVLENDLHVAAVDGSLLLHAIKNGQAQATSFAAWISAKSPAVQKAMATLVAQYNNGNLDAAIEIIDTLAIVTAPSTTAPTPVAAPSAAPAPAEQAPAQPPAKVGWVPMEGGCTLASQGRDGLWYRPGYAGGLTTAQAERAWPDLCFSSRAIVFEAGK